MNEDEPQEEAPSGGGIRLGNRRNKKKQKGGVERSSAQRQVLRTDVPKSTGIGYDERDVSPLTLD